VAVRFPDGQKVLVSHTRPLQPLSIDDNSNVYDNQIDQSSLRSLEWVKRC